MNINNKYIISMMDFLTNYLKLDNIDELLTKLNHYDLSELNIDGVKRVPNDLVTTEDIQTGRVLLVKSKGFKHHGNMVCAYLRPNLVKEDNLSDIDKMINESLYKADTPLFLNKSLKRKRQY